MWTRGSTRKLHTDVVWCRFDEMPHLEGRDTSDVEGTKVSALPISRLSSVLPLVASDLLSAGCTRGP